MLRPLTESQATRCLYSKTPRCRCRCRGVLHGAAYRPHQLDLDGGDPHKPPAAAFNPHVEVIRNG